MTIYTRPKQPGAPTWVDLSSPDPEAARQFYQTLFGWVYDVGGPEFGGYATARVGAYPAAGIGGTPPGTPPGPAFWNLYFATNDIDADVARAVSLGATSMFPPMSIGPFGSMAMLVDPTGAMFGFWQAGEHIGAQITGEPGSAAWYELYSPDAKKARDFYTALLGAGWNPMPPGLEYYVLTHGEEQLAGVMQIDPSWGDFRPQWMVYYAVSNADEAVATLKRLGGKALSKIDDTTFGRMVAVADAQGAQFKLLQPPAR